MKPTTTMTALFLASGALLAGCVSGSGGSQTTIAGGEGSTEMTELDAGKVLSRDLEIVQLVQVRKEGLLVAQFDLRNKRGSRLAVTWTIEWFDADGLKVNTNESWRTLVIGGKGFEALKVTAPTASATSWRLKVEKPNPVR